MAENKQLFFTLQEVANLLKVSTKTIRKAVNLQKFPEAKKILSCKRWFFQDIIRWAQSQKGGDI